MPQFGWDSADAARDRKERLAEREHDQRPPSLDKKASPDSRADHQKQGSQFSQSDQSELVIDPALRSNTPRSSAVDSDKKRDDHRTQSPANISMPLRAVEPASFMSSSHRRQHFDDSHRLPSPPASIAPVPHSHSPSPSVASADRSSISTPPIRRSPPQTSMPPPPHLFQSSYHHDPSLIQSSRHHPEHFARADNMTHGGYIYAPPPPPFDHRYDQPHPVNHSPYHHNPSAIPQHFSVPPPMAHHPPSYGHPYPQPGSQPPVQIMHTDDAATKLSDRVRRRCFNCCTTDTSTWRRSNLSPGKVLCNKCGLFERTHSRPRPEQFPHKRGPLATTSLQRRTPPANSNASNPNSAQHFQQPPPPPPGHLAPGHMPNHLPPIAPPYQYTHANIPPLNSSHSDGRRDSSGGSSGGNSNSNNNGNGNSGGNSGNTLPGLQSWHSNNNASNGGDSGQGSPHLGGGSSAPHSRRQSESHSSGHARLPTPPPSSLSRSVNSSQDSSRDPPSSSSRDSTA